MRLYKITKESVNTRVELDILPTWALCHIGCALTVLMPFTHTLYQQARPRGVIVAQLRHVTHKYMGEPPL